MISEIKIILEDDKSNKTKGNCFESLIRNLLSIHQYDIRGNINFSGMEIDLVAEHKHNKETLYVECKAKEKVSSDELSKFQFNVYHKKIDKGYFFRTQELEYQAGALLSEMKNDERYKNLTFYEPDKIITMLIDGEMICEQTSLLGNHIISKRILAVTYLGDFFVYLINESNALPTKFIIIDAKNNHNEVCASQIQILKERIPELSNLEIICTTIPHINKTLSPTATDKLETISEVQESENWYDYLPASANKNHFVGRDDIRTKILTFFKDARNNSTLKRIFYLNGKSGWGKSSLVLEIKERCSNKHYKKQFYALAIDTRSAISDNFVALSFMRLINKAIADNFIKIHPSDKDIKFTSNNDLLSSDSIITILDTLKTQNKFLVLIFDQFEDVFRQKEYFKTFYKFLTDVTDRKPNLIIGFSWKSDFFIQSDDPSYHIWQQAKEQAREFTINEFGEKEIDGIIKQLEGSVGGLDKGIKDRIKESSQGLPWLTKKLCIHIFDQIESGLNKDNLIEFNLNIINLFKKDEERLSADELKAIKLIAKKAYEGSFFEETEVGDVIASNTITSLLHKRLIIRSGANYNIYWDIFRDYLVTGNIPIIGESFILRQGVNLCFEVFQLFDTNQPENIDSLLDKHPKGITQETLYNILIELRNLEIIRKEGDSYILSSDITNTKQGFVDYITNKFSNYTPYIHLSKLSLNKITKEDVIKTLKDIFKQDFQERTWDSYAKNIINWLLFSDLEIKYKLIEPQKGRGKKRSLINIEDKNALLPRNSITNICKQLDVIANNPKQLNSGYYRDMQLLEIINADYTLTEFGQIIINSDVLKRLEILKNKVQSYPKMLKIMDIIQHTGGITSKALVGQLSIDFFDGEKESTKIIYASAAMSWLR